MDSNYSSDDCRQADATPAAATGSAGSHWGASALPPLARFAIGTGLALTALIVAGLVLNLFTPITATSWAAAVAVLVTLAVLPVAVIAVLRVLRRTRDRRATPGGQDTRRATPGGHDTRRARQAGPRGRGTVGWLRAHAPVPLAHVRSLLPAAGLLLLAVVLAGGAVVLAVRSAGWQQSAGFAQLWLVPEQQQTAQLGVRNHYQDTRTFSVELSRGSIVLNDWQLRLAAGQSWQTSVVAPAGSQLSARLSSPVQVLSVAVTP